MDQRAFNRSDDINQWLKSMPFETGSPLWSRFLAVRNALPDGHDRVFVDQVFRHCEMSRFRRLGELMNQILEECEVLL